MARVKLWSASLFSLVSIAATAYADVLDHWSTNQISTNSFALSHVVYGNGVYVAVAELSDGGIIFSSKDGKNWTQRFSDLNSWGLTLNYSGGHFSGVGGFGFADVSADGTNWTSSVLPDFDYYDMKGRSITYGNGVYVRVGQTNGVGCIQTSPDGINWTYRSVINTPGGRITSVAYKALRFVAIGDNDGYVYVSSGASAGSSWNRYSIVGGNKISSGNGLFIVPFNSKTNIVSADGINWSMNATGLTNQLGVVNYANGLFMAQCGISQSGSYLATSTDGTNWVQTAKQLPTATDFTDSNDFDVSIATDGTRLVAVAAARTNVAPYYYNSLVYTSDPVVEVGLTNSPSHQIVLSGLVGRSYQIQSATNLTGSWSTNITVRITNTPFFWSSSVTNSALFYRGVLLP